MKFALAFAAATLGVSSIVLSPAFAGEVAATPAFSTTTSTIGELIDNAQTKAVLDSHLPGFADNEQVAMARSLTLRQLQQFAPDQFTDEVLAMIDADLAKIEGK